ncbi:MAG TPA: sigma-70 family RNA polymerase sigma factor [Terracidiphilus sp.]|jgi:RNA polymerase sigma-70 factor (ECF subfamily)|nr:sigma-70 family RNA polymerase sigma factor [Terracidiphilus sp.]
MGTVAVRAASSTKPVELNNAVVLQLRRAGDGSPLRYTVQAVAENAGDFGSFEDLAMPHFARLYNLACWLTHDTTAAEDLVQETYMKALRGFSSFQQGTNFRAWMYRILRNTFLTSKTGLKTAATVDIDDESSLEPATEETPESVLLARVKTETIQQALEALPVLFREIILLCDLEEMSYQEIGQALGIPMGTVMSRLSRARKAMRTLLIARKEGTRQ